MTSGPAMTSSTRSSRAVSSCDVLLAIIGPQWLSVTGVDGGRRIDDPADWVRLEVGTALARQVRVIPGFSRMRKCPRARISPSNLVPLVRKHAFKLSPAHFKSDAEELVRDLEQALKHDTSRRDRGAWSLPVPVRRHSDSVTQTPRPSEPTPPIASQDAPAWQESTVVNPKRATVKQDAVAARTTGFSRLGRARWLVLGCAGLVLLATGLTVAVRQLATTAGGTRNPPHTGIPALPQSAQPLRDDVFVIRQERDGVRRIETIDMNGNLVQTLS